MTTLRNPRWLISFADLCLLLLAFFVLLHARQDRGAAVASVRAAFGAETGATPAPAIRSAATLFEPGEAMLRPAAASDFAAVGAQVRAAGGRLRVESSGAEAATARFDGWELAAARAAAVARASSRGGLPAERIDIVLAPVPAGSVAQGQQLRIVRLP